MNAVGASQPAARGPHAGLQSRCANPVGRPTQAAAAYAASTNGAVAYSALIVFCMSERMRDRAFRMNVAMQRAAASSRLVAVNFCSPALSLAGPSASCACRVACQSTACCSKGRGRTWSRCQWAAGRNPSVAACATVRRRVVLQLPSRRGIEVRRGFEGGRASCIRASCQACGRCCRCLRASSRWGCGSRVAA